MSHAASGWRTVRRALAALAAGLVAAGCASTPVDAQWVEPQFAGQSLRGSKLLVVCEATDLALQRGCQDHVMAELVAYGASPVVQAAVAAGTVRSAAAEPYLAAARAAGAKAIWLTSVAPDATVVQPGPSIGLGVGGFGRSVGGGVGISLPIGGAKTSTAYGANSQLTDVTSARLMWTAKTRASTTDDVNAQVSELVKSAVAAAGKAGFF
ncbi:hypothetical protein [Methylibium sp.]|uniref:hypothetical protein n=1 Tax=Methylibium sp. TaxID=2067992 RepID=UPI003D0CBF77